MSKDKVVVAVESAEILAFPANASLAGDRGGGDPPKQPPSDPPNDPPAGGDDDGVDGIVSRLNAEYSLVLMGSRALIMREMPDAPIEDRTRVLSLDAFKAYFSNRGSNVIKRERQEDGSWVERKRFVKWAPQWLNSRYRRTFDGLEFFPDPNNAAGTKGYFNLWRGFNCKPDASPPQERVKKYKTFRDHLFTNICNADKAIFDWVWAWCAHIVQRPRERIGTAIILRGKMGTGKTKFGEIIGSLFESHYFLVDDPRYLIGQFNAHMASCLLLQVDEGFWAGDKAAEGRLKGLITAPRQMIEAKGIDPIPIKNYVRLVFTSNEDWVVPAGLDERRFCVLDIAPHAAQNHAYFAEMDQEIANGGREALLADLLSLELDAPGAPNLRVIPKTAALLEQKLRSLDAVTAWWFERLTDGTTTRRGGEWRRQIPVDTMFDDYVNNAEKVGVRRKAEKISLAMKLRKLVPGLETRKQSMTIDLSDGSMVQRRVSCFLFPKLGECRAAFSAAVGQSVEWNDPDDGESGASSRENDDEDALNDRQPDF
ncbi:primase-helicase family protein [Methylocella tundrae]|uniref:NrS-1 polymerase-like helicase domain-containing protein n=1 Tax=Methylocella tundrae TaxID=227605 RepID=A0A4U8YVQ2_METTU|nr:primase-helicase family protein [Methylocella tundrae]WPP04782.1 DUF5906 domain-containing protein [Methylocella tundrae]VFU06998.1 conserved protein of unknown function [Methylocella tundrae]